MLNWDRNMWNGNQMDIKAFLIMSSLFCSIIYFVCPFSDSFPGSKLNKPLPIPSSTKYYFDEGDENNCLFCAITWWILYSLNWSFLVVYLWWSKQNNVFSNISIPNNHECQLTDEYKNSFQNLICFCCCCIYS